LKNSKGKNSILFQKTFPIFTLSNYNDIKMQTIQLKYDIISWITAVNDKNLIREIYQWIEEKKSQEISADGILPPRRKGSLTEGYGLWADEAPFDENNYRNRLWQTEKNVW
jgi:hypothetical protein